MDSIFWSQNLSNTLVEVVKTGIILTDIQGRIRFANNLALELLGYARDSLNGKSIEILFLPDDIRIFLSNIMKITLEGKGFEGEALLRKNDGGSFFVNLSTALYRGDANGNELIIFTMQDITHLKNMEKEYIGSERFVGLGMMTDQISHQIRNPIVSIGGFALRLAKEKVSDEEYSHYTRVIHDESRRLEYIIDRLAEFAKVYPVSYLPLTLSEVFEGVKKAFSNHLEGSPIKITFTDPEVLPPMPLYGDLALTIRAVQCVLQNALEAIPAGGEVFVTGEIAGNQVFIRIKDNGEGVLPKDLPYIFDPFFTTKFNYLGLGLTMAKRIVQEHMGQINVDSVPGQGTEVSIILPRERRREIRTKLL
jgi:PAS domain S-box-containing protein